MNNETLVLVAVFIFLVGLLGGLYFAIKEDKPAKKHP